MKTKTLKIQKIKVPKVKLPKVPKPRLPKQAKVIIREFFIDDDGKNKLITHSTDKTIVIFLQLESEPKRKRKIGVVTKSTRTIKVERKRELHLFKKSCSYGFNDYIFRNAKTFDKIWLFDEYDHWTFPVSYLMEHGVFLHFKGESNGGFELQRFLTLTDDLEQFRVKASENRRF